MQRLAVPFTLCSVWSMIVWASGRFWLDAVCAPCVSLFWFELAVKAHDVLSVTTGRINAMLLVGVPLFAYMLALIPYRALICGAAWSDAISRWSRPFFWLALIGFWVWLGEIVYSMLALSLPDGFGAYAQGYRLNLSGTAPGLREITLVGRFGAFLGLLLGLYLFLSRGLARP